MKKTIVLFILSFCLTHHSQAQIDTNRMNKDTNTLGQNKVHNKQNLDSINTRINKDSINNKKKMPPKKSNGASTINEKNLLYSRKEMIV
ncbi:MAG: hypothetical protein QM737_15640 [Ferruginibacter sp.]